MIVELTPITNSAYTLQSYITDAQRLLHDSTYRYNTQAELIDYVNKARRKVAMETGCLRMLFEGVSVPIDAKKIAFDDIYRARRIIGILDIYLNYSPTSRLPLDYQPYSDFSRMATVVYSYKGTPIAWSQHNQNAFITPIPSVDYTADFDVSVEPYDIVALTDIDSEIISPFTGLIKFYVAYLCKLKQQRRKEAEDFLVDYLRERSSVVSSSVIRRLIGR